MENGWKLKLVFGMKRLLYVNNSFFMTTFGAVNFNNLRKNIIVINQQQSVNV